MNNMEEIEDDFIIEEEGYTINSEGSSFQHCTPNCLGPDSGRILALDYSKMKYIGVAVNYSFRQFEGFNAPYLTFEFISQTNKGDTKFAIICSYYCPEDYRSINSMAILPLPDINALTPFSEAILSMEVKHYSNYSPGYQKGVLESTITLRTENNAFEINCVKVEFKFLD